LARGRRRRRRRSGGFVVDEACDAGTVDGRLSWLVVVEHGREIHFLVVVRLRGEGASLLLRYSARMGHWVAVWGQRGKQVNEAKVSRFVKRTRRRVGDFNCN
jgi:hypothetical protein